MSHPGMRYSNGGSFTMMKTSAKSSAPEIANETSRSLSEFGQRWERSVRNEPKPVAPNSATPLITGNT